MPVVTGRMQNREHDNGVLADNEENSPGKSPGQHAPNLWSSGGIKSG